MGYGNALSQNGGAEAVAPREPLASMAENLGNEVGALVERLQKLNDRLIGATPHPAELADGKPEASPPVNRSMSRLASNIRRCHNVMNEIEESIG